MNDALGMTGGKRIRYLNADVEDFLQLHRFAQHALLEADALQALHDDKRVAVGVLNVVDGANAGVVELRSGAGFPKEALQRFMVLKELGWNELESDVPA